MDTKEKILNDFKQALKSGDSFRRGVLVMIKSSIQNKEIEKGAQEKGLTEEDVIEVVTTEAKKRRDAASQFRKGGREDLAKKEEQELVILGEYLPQQLSPEEVARELKNVIEAAGSNKKADFGRLMGMAAGKLKGKADGNLIKVELEKLLE